ncbi:MULTISPECIES: diphthine--ammonia ligase [Roseivirga]|uniref:Dph6-related ATP pyrophosphatase n=1 Tax=Roseivirga TaxID=290180 RepID=UPI001E5F1C7D|nr:MULTISPECIES: diphthine--ammonia ligase [Roseivirga]
MSRLSSNPSWPFLCSWSGGKDSYLAYCKALTSGGCPKVLLNVLNESGKRSRSHGIPRELLQMQAMNIGLPITFIETEWTNYESRFVARLQAVKSEYDLTHAVYGDIDIEEHRSWEEKVSKAAGLQAYLPLWKKGRRDLVLQMLELNMQCLIVSCQEQWADAILGKTIDHKLLNKFGQLGIDACGENGEYHTFVVNGPLHNSKMELTIGGVEYHNGYAFLEIS